MQTKRTTISGGGQKVGVLANVHLLVHDWVHFASVWPSLTARASCWAHAFMSVGSFKSVGHGALQLLQITLPAEHQNLPHSPTEHRHRGAHAVSYILERAAANRLQQPDGDANRCKAGQLDDIGEDLVRTQPAL